MRSRSLALAFTLMVVTLTGARAADAPAPAVQPLRTLTYDVVYTLQTSQSVKVSGLTGGDPHGMEMGNASVQSGLNSNDKGTLQIDVIAAPADGTLVVDASYAGHESRQAPVRVVIFADGTLTYDPKYLLSAQARHVLPLLARGLLVNHVVSAGSSWKTPVAKPAQGETKYRVTKQDDKRATFDISADVIFPGPSGYDEHDDATMTYATDVLCPVSFDGRQRLSRHTSPERVESTNSHVTATLVSDSFAKK